ncbi:MAG: hypothetical protein MI922_24670, partial [Bacteroidales bacterium]|nr:hypothetical protein [Bacteroidales bacterium]
MIKDNKGYIWVGTSYGLFRFDGYESRHFVFNSQSNELLLQNRIYSMAYNNESLLWLGTAEGIKLFDISSHEFINLNYGNIEDIIHSTVWYSHIDPFKNIWFSTSTGFKIGTYKNDTLRFFYHSDKDTFWNKNECRIDALCIDEHNTYWLGMNKKIYFGKIEPGKNNHHKVKFKIANKQVKLNIHCLHRDKKDNIIGSAFQTVYRFYTNHQKFEKLEIHKAKYVNVMKHIVESYPSDDLNKPLRIISDISEDDFGNIWLSSRNGLLQIPNYYSLDKLEFVRYNNDPFQNKSIYSNSLSNLLYDNNGNLFIANSKDGFDILDINQKRFSKFGQISFVQKQQIMIGDISAIEEDKFGKLYLGSTSAEILTFTPLQNQVAKIKDEKFHNYMIPKPITDICFDEENNLWVSTHGGIKVIRPKQKLIEHIGTRFDTVYKLKSRNNHSIEPDNFKSLWLAAKFGGINRIHYLTKGKMDNFNCRRYSRHHFSCDKINYILHDSLNNHLWFCSIEGLDQVFLDSLGNISQILHYIPNGKIGSLSGKIINSV